MTDHTVASTQRAMTPDFALQSLEPIRDAETILKVLASFTTNSYHSFEDLLLFKMQILERILGVHSIYVCELISEQLIVIKSYGVLEEKYKPGLHIPIVQRLDQHVQQRGRIVVFENIANYPEVQRSADEEQMSISAYIGAPLYHKTGALRGILSLVDTQPRTFSDAQLSLVQIIAGDIAYSLEREQLLERMVQAMNDAGTDLSATLDLIDRQQSVLRIVAHDLRTPLSAVYTGSSALLQGMFGPIDPAKQRVVDLMDQASRYMNRLVNDLVDASAAEDPMLGFVSERFNVIDMGHELIAMCQPRAKEANLQLSLDNKIADPMMTGDRERLLQALMNLITNAINYTSSGGVTLRIRSEADQVFFDIIDTGQGIKQEDIHRIWEPHVRASRRGKGLGLGLYVVTLLARKMGGEVGVESTLGVGSTFWIRLPRTVLTS